MKIENVCANQHCGWLFFFLAFVFKTKAENGWPTNGLFDITFTLGKKKKKNTERNANIALGMYVYGYSYLINVVMLGSFTQLVLSSVDFNTLIHLFFLSPIKMHVFTFSSWIYDETLQ